VAIDSQNSLGLYLIPIELGSAIGAIKVSFSPGDIPDGIRGIYNNGVFNEFSSEVDGYHATSVTDGLTYMGNSADVGSLITGSPHGSIIEYDFYNSIYTPNGNTTTVEVSAGSASLSASKPPDTCIAYIPKTLSSPTTLSMQIAEVLGSQPTPSWSLTVGCPTALTSNQCTDVNPAGGCTTAAPLDNTIFLGKVSGVNTIPVIHDWAFADAYAETKKATGDYVLENKTAVRYLITVSANGVITAVTACP
tara:strand:+ start:174 stop:920 length:747 start_codon:yes stop_codon:yes gene_type:complete